jgi:hypothetical protein
LGLAGVDEGGDFEEGSKVEVAGVAEVVQVAEQLDEGLVHFVGVAVADLAVAVQCFGGVGGAMGVGLAGSGGAGGEVLTIRHIVA